MEPVWGGRFGGSGASFGPVWLGHYGAVLPREFRRYGSEWHCVSASLGDWNRAIAAERHPAKVSVRGPRWRRVGGRTGFAVVVDFVRSQWVSGRVACVKMAHDRRAGSGGVESEWHCVSASLGDWNRTMAAEWHSAKVSVRGGTLAAGWGANQIAARCRRPSRWWERCPKMVGFGPGGLCQNGARRG